MGVFNRKSFMKGLFSKQGQITLTVVWKVLAIIFLVIAAVVLWNVHGTISNYLAKFYDCMRFGC